MNAVAMADVVLFARRWLEAGTHVVQYWPSWESQARAFFGDRSLKADEDVFHGLMNVVCCVCFGTAEVVKEAVREASPRVLGKCVDVVGHLPQFAVVLEAETRFRGCQLSADWSLQQVDGKLVVRSEFRSHEGTEH